MVQLALEKPFDELTIREIASTAGVSYPTFFRYYASKVELIGDIGGIEAQELLSVMLVAADKRDPGYLARATCRFVHERRQLWTVLLGSEAIKNMRDVYSRDSLEYASTHPQIRPDVPLDLISSFVVNSMFHVLSWWLLKAPQLTSDEAAVHLKTLVLGPSMVGDGLRAQTV